MKFLTTIFTEAIKKPRIYVSTDNFTNILAEDDYKNEEYVYKINVEDDFIDDATLALYKAGASKYKLKFELLDNADVSASISGTSTNLIKFLIDILGMLYSTIKNKYPKLDFTEYEKSNK